MPVGDPPLPDSSGPGLLGLLARSAADPDATALRVAGADVALSYGALGELAERVADELLAAGVVRGTAVGLAMPNSLAFVLSLFGIARAGAVPAPLDPGLTAAELAARLDDVGAGALVVPASIPSTPVAAGLPAVLALDARPDGTTVTTSVAVVRPGDDRPPAPPPDLHDVDLVMFTAGTTGRSKAVPWSPAAVDASARGIVASLELRADDSTVLVMPLHHGHGLMTGLVATLATGGTATLPATGKFSAHRFWEEMVGARATWYTGVPTIHQILLARADREYPGPARIPLRFIRSCSAPLPDPVARAIEARFGAPVIGAYGMTETTHQTTSMQLADSPPGTPVTVGTPTSIEVRVAAADGADAPAGTPGQILVRGPTLTAGYLNDEEANRSAFVDGWFATGDLGSLDDQGRLTVTGRLKELIDRGGEKVAPSTVEAALLADPAVVDAAVFGLPDPVYGERVEAAVALAPGSDTNAEEVRARVAGRLSKVEVPERILVLDQLPHTAKGSPDVRALAAMARDDDGTGDAAR